VNNMVNTAGEAPAGSAGGESGPRRHRAVLAAVAMALAAGAMALGSADVAGAESSVPNTAVFGDNDFYAYVGMGENLDVLFTKQPGSASAGAVVTVEGPGVGPVTCSFASPEVPGETCSFTDRTAPTAGVWRIAFDHEHTTGYLWQIEVQDTGSTTIPGRVWTEDLGVMQMGQLTYVADMPLWYQSEFGYLYEATHLGMHGINSRLRADATGVRLAGGCLSAYRSVLKSDPGFGQTALGECGSPYKIFFAPPAVDLPASASLWDGGSTWVRPPVVAPQVGSLTFTQDSSTARSGDIAYTTSGFSGQFSVSIDTNDDGVFDGPADVTIPAFSSGSGSVRFDGNDGQGNPVPVTQPVRIRARIDRTGEVHFVSNDVETRGDGIEVTRLNGPGSPDPTLYWDDSLLPNPDPNKCGTFPPQTAGTAGVDSSGGVHPWDSVGCPGAGQPGGALGNVNNGVNGSWGDVRLIEDWTYVAADAQLVISCHP
jgi:hypothetical protein